MSRLVLLELGFLKKLQILPDGEGTIRLTCPLQEGKDTTPPICHLQEDKGMILLIFLLLGDRDTTPLTSHLRVEGDMIPQTSPLLESNATTRLTCHHLGVCDMTPRISRHLVGDTTLPTSHRLGAVMTPQVLFFPFQGSALPPSQLWSP